MTRALKPYGINVPRWRILAVLSTREYCTIAELARLTSLSQPGVSQVVEQLEAESTVSRTVDPSDNRYQKIGLTEKGRDLFDRILPIAMEYQDRLTVGFNQDEKELAITLCRKMLDNIK